MRRVTGFLAGGGGGGAHNVPPLFLENKKPGWDRVKQKLVKSALFPHTEGPSQKFAEACNE